MTGNQHDHDHGHAHISCLDHGNNITHDNDPPPERKKRKIENVEDLDANTLPLEGSERQDTKPKKQQPRLKPTAQVLITRRLLQQCCRNNDLAKAMQVYHQANNEGTLVEAQSLYNLLNLCDGLGERPLHIGTPSQTRLEPKKIEKDREESYAPESEEEQQQQQVPVVVDSETRQEFAFLVKKDMDDRNLPMNETAYTALIRILSKAMRLDEANQLLRKAEQTQQCKMRLRLYSSLLSSYCQVDQLDRAIDLWVRLDTEKLSLTEREYTAMIQCAARTGNAPMVERCLSELAEDVLIPSKDTVQALVNWFQSPHATSAVYLDDDDGGGNDSQRRFEIEPPPCHVPSMGPIEATTPWTIDSGCTIKDGVLQTGCLQGHVLQPVPLLQQACQEMIDFNETIVLHGMVDGHESSFQGGGKGPKRKVDFAARGRNWNGFKDFLLTNYIGGLDVVIDGANVGYYKQNFSHARQIDTVVQHFARLGKTILLVLHARHFSHHLMPEWARPIVKSWSSILYRANHGMNDDWFWLHAALWGNATVVTNDEMRDHHFQMLAPRSFLRWKERHQIHFCFEVVNGKRILKLTHPNKYSRRVQRIGDGLVVPLAKRGDENRFLDGVHVANEEEPEEETYLCICSIKG